MLGSVARFLLVSFVARTIPTNFPWGTMTVNVAGSLIIGMVLGLSLRLDWMTDGWRLFLATGFCGGFTTFSAFAYENMVLLEQRHYSAFLINTFLSIAVCLAAVYLGVFIARG
jgi:fluoride exporter